LWHSLFDHSGCVKVESQTRAAALSRSKANILQKLASANLMQLAGAAVAAVMAWEGMKRGEPDFKVFGFQY
jgi:hypothetical protein